MRIPTVRPPLFMLLFFSIFGFVGIAVLVFLWSGGDDFDSPPLIFKVVGSLISLGFMAMGFGVPLTALRKSRGIGDINFTEAVLPRKGGNYECPSCGANVKDAEVSPAGDVKCPYCNGWWNVHQA